MGRRPRPLVVSHHLGGGCSAGGIAGTLDGLQGLLTYPYIAIGEVMLSFQLLPSVRVSGERCVLHQVIHG